MSKRQLLSQRRIRQGSDTSFLPEILESRHMFSVSLNAQGFTVITPGSTDRVIYCSSSTGNNQNNGLSPNQAVQTLAQAESLLQNHTGDQLLLKAGDTWHTGFGYWTLGGASAAEPMVIGSYGTGARPIIMSGTGSGITTGKSSTPEVDYLAILGIHFWADGRDPSITPRPAVSNPTGINILSKSNDILVEDCMVQDYDVNLNFQDYYGPVQNVSVRRNVIVDAWSTNEHAQGMYALGMTNLTIDGNVFDHNGWNTQIHGAGATIYNHDCYISADNSGVVVENNIFSRASATGLEDRPGGIVKNNLFLDDPFGLTFGLVNGADTTPGGVHGAVTGNVFIGSPPAGTIAQGQAIQVGNIAPNSGTVISDNIFTSGGPSAGTAIGLMYGIGQIDPQKSIGINDLTISDNTFYDWTTGIDVESGLRAGGKGLTALNNLRVVGNNFENMSDAAVNNGSAAYLVQETWSGNTYYNSKPATNPATVKSIGTARSTPFAFPHPGRSIASFDALIGGPGTDAHFLTLARLQSQANWSWCAGLTTASLNAYIANGFA
jgi:hypothetical protein